MRLLVTGCGRSGTVWLARALCLAGVDCGHERTYSLTRCGEGGWSAEVSWLAAPHPRPADVHVVHLVRHPLAVIRSQVARGGLARRAGDRREAYDRYIYRHLPGLRDLPTQLERCAAFWVRWNRLVDADERMRVEDVTAETVTRLARVVDPSAGLTGLPPRAHRGRAAPLLRWRDVGDQVAELALRYGYEVEGL